MLQRLEPKDSTTDLLFVGTERFQYFTLRWNSEKKELDSVNNESEDVAEMFMRRSHSQNKCLVDPTGKFMAMHLWEGVLNVFRLLTRKGNTMKLEHRDQIRLQELYTKSSTFIHSRDGHPRIAFLYRTRLDARESHLAIYRLTKDDKDADVSRFDPTKDREYSEKLADDYASLLIPVPVDEDKRYNVRKTEPSKVHLGGLIVVGETMLTYVDSLTTNSVFSRMAQPKIYVAWTEINGTNYLLSDDYGRLDLVTINTNKEPTGEVVTGMTIRPILSSDSPLITSKATTLVNMGYGKVFLGSHQGDSEFLNVDIESRQATRLKSISNNAPILDFTIMDMGNREGEQLVGNAFSSGQARIVAGCGAYRDGSLRSIRSGVGLFDDGILDDLEETKGLFSLSSQGSAQVDTILMSSISDTRVFKFDVDGGIEEVEPSGLDLTEPTLFAATLEGGQTLQITSQSVRIAEDGVLVSDWNAEDGKRITAASANDKWALICVDGGTLISLDLHNALSAKMQHSQSAGDASEPDRVDQISCLYVSRDRPDLGVVGWWRSGTVSVISLSSLEAVHGETLRSQGGDGAAVPRDVVLAQLHPLGSAGPTLVIAQEDGNVVTFNVSVEGFSLSGRKTVTLGSNPARLNVLPKTDGTNKIFATTEHASLIYSSEGRIVYSATTADDATFVVPFDSHAYPGAIILSTDKYLRISHIDDERLTHVKTLPVYETVRRIAYSPSLKVFGLGCIKRELEDDEEIITSSFRLVDEIIFKELGEPFMLKTSPNLEIVESVIRAELPDSAGVLVERFIVGTSIVAGNSDGGEPTHHGRIIILGVDDSRKPFQIMSHALKGSCRCLKIMGNQHIVAGLNKTVVVYEYEETSPATGKLHKVAAYRPAAIPVDLDVEGDVIGVVDLTQSLTILKLSDPKTGNREDKKLEEVARHMHYIWTTCVSNIEHDRWIEADADGNIIVTRYRRDAPDEHLRHRMETTSEMNIGEQINKIRKLNVPSSENSVVWPRAFLGSVSYGTAAAF